LLFLFEAAGLVFSEPFSGSASAPLAERASRGLAPIFLPKQDIR
jgi:hypothetical protein